MGNTVKTALLLGLLSGVLLALGEWLGGSSGLILAFVIAVAMNFGSYWFSDKIVLRMYRAQPVGPEHPLHGITARLAQRANLPMPKVYVIPDDSPNAFATGRNPRHAAVAATTGLLRFLDEPEIEGVIAHELAHVKHRDILISSVAATVAATIMMVSRMAQWAAIFGGFGRDDEQGSNPLALLATIIVAPLAAMLIQAAISRSREFAADRGAVAIAGESVRPGRRAEEDRGRPAARSAGRESCNGAHVHHDAPVGSRAAVALQHAPADRTAHPGAAGNDLSGITAAAGAAAGGHRPARVLAQVSARDRRRVPSAGRTSPATRP